MLSLILPWTEPDGLVRWASGGCAWIEAEVIIQLWQQDFETE